jgi:hypothetical protein
LNNSQPLAVLLSRLQSFSAINKAVRKTSGQGFPFMVNAWEQCLLDRMAKLH